MNTKAENITQIATQFNLSESAVGHLWDALVNGNGTMAQFNHPELGGMGQWQSGGMLMIGDMFNNQLKLTIGNLFGALAPLVSEALLHPGTEEAESAPPARSAWWPAEYGTPTAAGSQNGMRYAYFPGAKRLVVDQGGSLSIYDTEGHHITGASQQNGDVTFNTPNGSLALDRLPKL